MDGLSALSVATGVAHLIEFGANLAFKNKEISQSANGLAISNSKQ
jgi:hypothetical protein